MMNFDPIILIIYILSIHYGFSFSLSSFITNYETLNYQPTHQIQRRSVSNNMGKRTLRINFHAFEKTFNLNVSHDHSVWHPDTEIIVNEKLHRNEDVIAVSGFVIGHRKSNAYGTVVDGLFRGVIKVDNDNDTIETYYVEHSGYHFDDDPGFHSIIYRDSDINDQRNHNESFIEPKHCGWSQPEVANEMRSLSSNSDRNKFVTSSHSHKHSRHKRNTSSMNGQYVCNLFLQSDTFLWSKIMSLHHVKGQHDLAVKEISSIFTQHVQGAQAVYQNTVFQTFDGRGRPFNGIGFRVDRVRINTTEDCEPPLKNNNPFCSPNIDVTNFLNLNSYMKHDDFCLAYIFTYRDFNGGTLGLAWVAEPGGSGGVCEKNRPMQEAGWNVRKSLNTGIVTLLNYGSYVALKVSQLTFAHEMGHNFGSKHDDDHKGHNQCLPPSDDPNGNFIMFASATSGEKENNNKFSSCSKDSIARLLHRVTGSQNNCFKNQEGSFCGNKLTEEGEQCDCGYSQKDCQDQCCHPKLSSASCKLTSSILIGNIRKKVLCSPNAGECCNKDCQFESQSKMCRYRGECYNAAYCTGNSTKCPKSDKRPDLTRCQDNTRVCKNGECVGSICESVPGWQECSIVRKEGVTPEMMCFVACKRNLTASPCISTLDLQKDPSLRTAHPELVHALMPSSKAIQLKAGAPCDNFHGYCDVFLRCRSVEADGPLARIKNMIFSSLMVNALRTWVTQFWWAVMLICIGFIIFVGLFLRLCSRSTPSVNPAPLHLSHGHRHRSHHSNRTNAVADGVPASSRHIRRTRPASVMLQASRHGNVREERSRPLSVMANAPQMPPSLAHIPSYPPPAYESVGYGCRPPTSGKRDHR